EPPAPARPGLWPLAFAASMGLELMLALAAFAPALGLLALLGSDLPTLSSSFAEMLLECVVITAIAVPLTALLVAVTLRFVWRLVRPGWHDDHGPTGWALWFGEELKKSSITPLFPLYASMYTRPWFRLMGIPVGRGTEISVSTGLNPLVSFGELSQCTDDIGFCTTRSRDGWMEVAPIEIGKRSFLGPGSILRGGTRLGDDRLLGVMTLSPEHPAPGTSWLGVPALELPRKPDAADAARTTAPPRRLRIARAAMDLLRLLGPNTVALYVEVLELMAIVAVCVKYG